VCSFVPTTHFHRSFSPEINRQIQTSSYFIVVIQQNHRYLQPGGVNGRAPVVDAAIQASRSSSSSIATGDKGLEVTGSR
jgi:hypothetical protein